MKTNSFYVLLFDDDSKFVEAIIDDLKFGLRNMNLGLILAQDLSDLNNILKSSNEVLVAILDLWIIDKNGNHQRYEAGENALKVIRKKWPESYIIFLSSHLDNETGARLKGKYKQIALANKPIPTDALLGFVKDIKNRIGV